jgi:L-asparaginase II
MPIYCKVTRGSHVESQHSIYAVAVNEVGEIIFSTGDPEYQTCIRSSFKPFQAAASVHAGAVKSAGFTDEELALMCASHNGEEIHVKTAKSMMNKLGFSKDYYECGNHAPYDTESKIALLHKKKDYSPFNNNCSGKHAGMLALAKHLGAEPAGYTNRDHPVQNTIFDLLRIYSGQNEIVTAIDGCSAPTPFMSLHSIALLFQKLASRQYAELEEVY